KRLTTAVSAITESKADTRAVLCQMVRFMEGGQVLKMSKRAGTFVSVAEAIKKVGQDVIRFMMVWRKNDAPLDFDFDKVVEQTRENPIFYVQYAHARCCSVKRHVQESFPELDLSPRVLEKLDLSGFQDPTEVALIKQLVTWPRHVETAALAQEPHRIAYHLYEIAGAFHSLWTKGREASEVRFIFPEDPEKS